MMKKPSLTIIMGGKPGKNMDKEEDSEKDTSEDKGYSNDTTYEEATAVAEALGVKDCDEESLFYALKAVFERCKSED